VAGGGNQATSPCDESSNPKLDLLLMAFAGVWFWPSSSTAEAVRWYEEERGRSATHSFTAMKALERAVQLDGDFILAHARLAEAATEWTIWTKLRAKCCGHRRPPARGSFCRVTKSFACKRSISPCERLREAGRHIRSWRRGREAEHPPF